MRREWIIAACLALVPLPAAPGASAPPPLPDPACTSAGSERVERTYVDPARDAHRVPVQVHLPRAAAGERPCARGLIAFGHGFMLSPRSYRSLAEGLARHGYAVALPDTERGLRARHDRLAQDLGFVLRAAASDPALAGRIGPVRVLGGHSMGGGAAVLATAHAADADGIFALAPARTRPDAVQAARRVRMPLLFITGSRDCVTPAARHADVIFAALPPGQAHTRNVRLDAADHCGITDQARLCRWAEATCRAGPAADPQAQQSATLAVLLPWLQSLPVP